jgi:hypothetical protein
MAGSPFFQGAGTVGLGETSFERRVSQNTERHSSHPLCVLEYPVFKRPEVLSRQACWVVGDKRDRSQTAPRDAPNLLQLLQDWATPPKSVFEKCVVALCSSSPFVLGFAGDFEDEDEGRGRNANRILTHLLNGRLTLLPKRRDCGPGRNQLSAQSFGEHRGTLPSPSLCPLLSPVLSGLLRLKPSATAKDRVACGPAWRSPRRHR